MLLGRRRLLLGVVRIVLLLLRESLLLLLLRGMVKAIVGRWGVLLGWSGRGVLLLVMLRLGGRGILLLLLRCSRLYDEALGQLLPDHRSAEKHRHDPRGLHHLISNEVNCV